MGTGRRGEDSVEKRKGERGSFLEERKTTPWKQK